MGNDLGNKLEPPKLGFKRKRTTATSDTSEPADAVETEPLAAVPDTQEQPALPDNERESEPRPSMTARLPRLPKLPSREKAAAEPEPAREPKAPKPPKAPREPREVPVSDGPLAAGLVGLVVGVFLVVAVWLCEQLSQQSRGTTSLGGAGFPLLVGIFILAVVGGALLLRLAKTPSPGSVSFLATGLVAVLSMLFLADHSDSFVAGVVVVVLAIAAFVLSRWVSVRYIDAD
jgi:hypothetical protein